MPLGLHVGHALMRHRERIRIAALTARLLGYTVKRASDLNGSEYAIVYGPRNSLVLNQWVSQRIYPERCPLLSDVELLGHFLTRLHMERHFNIKTEHYWET